MSTKSTTMNLKEVAKFLGYNSQYVRKLFVSSFRTAKKDSSGKWLVDRSEIEAFRKSRSNRYEIPEGYLSVTQISEVTKYNEQYVRKLCSEGKWQAKLINGRYVALESDVINDVKPEEIEVDDSYVTLTEFAEQSFYNIQYVRKLCISGKLDAEKINNKWYIKKTEIQRKQKS